MSDHYHDPADIKRLKDMRALAPASTAWVNFNRIIARADGAIPRKYRELIVGVSVAVQCPFCMEAHAKGASGCGRNARRDRRGDSVASAIRAGAATTHGTMAPVLRPGRRHAAAKA